MIEWETGFDLYSQEVLNLLRDRETYIVRPVSVTEVGLPRPYMIPHTNHDWVWFDELDQFSRPQIPQMRTLMGRETWTILREEFSPMGRWEVTNSVPLSYGFPTTSDPKVRYRVSFLATESVSPLPESVQWFPPIVQPFDLSRFVLDFGPTFADLFSNLRFPYPRHRRYPRERIPVFPLTRDFPVWVSRATVKYLRQIDETS